MSKTEEQVRTLWKEVFGDSDSFIEHFMSRYYSRENLLFVEEEGTIQSMLHLIPFHYKGCRIGVVYALATASASRSKGYATLLLRRAIERAASEGYIAIALIPAEESLFSYYHRLGFTGKYRVDFLLPDDFDFGIDDKENQWLTIMPLTDNNLLPVNEEEITLARESTIAINKNHNS